jgi:hypothetical protein
MTENSILSPFQEKHSFYTTESFVFITELYNCNLVYCFILTQFTVKKGKGKK